MSLHITNAARISQHFASSPYHNFYDNVSKGSLKNALSLLRKSYDVPTSTNFMRYLFVCIAEDAIEGILTEEFDVLPKLVERLLELGADPNVSFLRLSIGGDDHYSNLTCWHIAYLYGRYLEFMRGPEQAEVMRTMFYSMLGVFGLNLRAKFSEEELCDRGHFAEDAELDGEYLEEVTLAQYALAMGDFETLQALIDKDPSLVHETCFMITAKNLLDGEYCWDETLNEETSEWESVEIDFEALRKPIQIGELANAHVESCGEYYRAAIKRYERVSFYHLAARRRDIEICFYLRGCGVDPRQLDSDKRSMLAYAKIGPCSAAIEQTQLKRIAQLMNVAVSPGRSRDFPPTQYYLIKEGYDLVNNPSTKCSVVHYCLTRSSYFRVAHRKGRKFKEDPAIPSYNRALPIHYAGSGNDTGHQKNADSSTSSEKSMSDSFLLTNALLQDPNLNKGYWKYRVEKMVYNLVQRNQCVEVFVGPVFTNEAEGKNGSHLVSYQVIGSNGPSKPTHIFVVVYLHNFGRPTRYLSYLVPNKPIETKKYPKLDPEHPPQAFRSPLQHIQQLSGIGFLNWRPNVKEYRF